MYRLPVLLVLLTCASSVGGGTRLSEPTEDEARKVEALGSEAADALVSSLMHELLSALQDGGPAHAVDFCSERALPLTQEVSDRFPGIELKRTTGRARNPLNRPDQWERLALETYVNSTRDAPLVQKIEGDESTVFRYYRPLRIGTPCLRCHGPSDLLAEEVRQSLTDHYPDDRATGYHEGDFRGLIRVEITASHLAAH